MPAGFSWLAARLVQGMVATMTRTFGRWLAMLGLLAGTLTPALATSAHADAAARIPDTRIEFGVGQIHPCQPGGNCYPHWCITGRTPWVQNELLYVQQCDPRLEAGQVFQISRYVPGGITYIAPAAAPQFCIGQRPRLFTWWAVKAVDCLGNDPSARFHLITGIDHGQWLIYLPGPNRFMVWPYVLKTGKRYSLQWSKALNPRVYGWHFIFPRMFLAG